jgi:hypothetical protein
MALNLPYQLARLEGIYTASPCWRLFSRDLEQLVLFIYLFLLFFYVLVTALGAAPEML